MTCLESVQKKIDFKPEVALILGLYRHQGKEQHALQL